MTARQIETSHKSLTVIIGSGGLKPMAAIPVVSFLKQFNITPELVIGCSGGCYISATWAAGYSVKRMHQMVKRFENFVSNDGMFSQIDYRTMLGIAHYPFGAFDKRSGILDPAMLHSFYKEEFGNTLIEDLAIKSLYYATDLDTGKGVIIDKGLLRKAVYASGALYPLLPPLQIDNKWLVDGAYTAAVPILEAIKYNSEVILVLMFEQPNPKGHKGFMPYFGDFVNTVAVKNSAKHIRLAVDMHPGEIVFLRFVFPESISITEVGKIPFILDVGEKVLEKHKTEILRAILN